MLNQTSLINQTQEVREIIKELFEPKASIFWTDLLVSATLGWGFFIVACLANPLSWQMLVAVVAAAIALYRSLIFIHELTHLKSNALTGFALIWNLLIGIPLLLPSFTYIGVHSDHHRLSTYGTAEDPEYMPFAGKKKAIIFFVAHSLLLPALLILRFVILSPIGLIVPALHRILECHASSLSMNLAYCRKVSPTEREKIKLTEILILGVWAIPIGLALYGIVSWRIFALWYGVVACIMVVNSLRTLGAHRYHSNGNSMSLEEQLLDSIDTSGALWTTLWAPVGLRYHALHHYFPSMPYHNLPIAYQRLHQALSPNTPYCLAKSTSLWSSLKTLWIERQTSLP